MSLRASLEKIGECLWRLPKQGQMRVPGLIVASEDMLGQIFSDEAPQQVANSATLPGIVKHALAMPDIHWGYGFPIGGVVATDLHDGVISPGGVGFDINCGVRLLRSDIVAADAATRISDLLVRLFQNIPCGVGASGDIRLTQKELQRVLSDGAHWAVEAGYGLPDDIECAEDTGCLDGADAKSLSPRALERGRGQLGTLGSGNHFLEVQVVDTIYDEAAAHTMGLFPGQLTIMIHSGSRGLGHQVCEDNVKLMHRSMRTHGINVPDRQLACAPLKSAEGKQYLTAMRAAANFAYANRQCMTHLVRRSFEQHFGKSDSQTGMQLVYDVTHNTAKIEQHEVDGTSRQLCVHRKGATRSLPPHHPDIPDRYSAIGQPVLVPGDMGRCSYILTGNSAALDISFGSTCHGAGRLMSRRQAVRNTRGRDIIGEMQERGVTVMSRGKHTLREECPEAYKDVSSIVSVVEQAGLSSKVAKLRPIGVVKG
jgi:tRNA-splicing ligase RtcB (3'-phosphate/5'-hydroxy nucleic acid ligase)